MAGAQPATVAKPSPPIKRLMAADVTEWRNDGYRFHYNELFTNGHKLVCK
jgi:hypothetical protein